MRYANLIRQFRNWPQYFLHKWGRRTRPVLVFQMRCGISIEVPTQLMVEFKEVFFAGCYGRHLGELGNAANIVDIGANVGFFTLFAASRFPDAHIHSYEPVPANFQQLQANLARNPGLRVHPHPQAVGATAGRLAMHLNCGSQFTTSASLVTDAGGSTIEVECAEFTSVIQRLPEGRCDFLKLDCEGAEYEILYGSAPELLGRIRHLAMECHHRDDDRQNVSAMAAFLEQHQFAVHAHGNMLYANPKPA